MIQLLIIYYFPGLVSWKDDLGRRRDRTFYGGCCMPLFLTMPAIFLRSTVAGIQGVPQGQEEAGLVLGMTKAQIFFKVTLLQMIKRIVPPMSNEIITLVKDTSLGTYYCPAGDHLGRTGFHERFPGNLRSHLAAVLHGSLLS